MNIKILELSILESSSITIVRTDCGYINPKGWLFPCLICSNISSKIRFINTIDDIGKVKSIICKDCKNKEYFHSKSYSHYLKYYDFYKLRKIYC